MKTTTVGRRGMMLPIGVPKQDGTLEQSFTLRPYKSRIDRHLGHWRDANLRKFGEDQGQLLAHMTAKFVSLILESVGGKTVSVTEDLNSTPQAELEIHQWALADVLYVYYMARITSLGSDLVVSLSCQRCTWAGQQSFDLNTADVSYAESGKELDLWVDLKKPFTSREGQKIRSVRIGPVRWTTLSKPGALQNRMSELGYHSLIDAIYGINGNAKDPYTLTTDELDEMEKVDRIRIDLAVGAASPGVDLKTTVACPKCGTLIVDPLNWTYDHFFGDSVPSAI